MEYAKHPNYGFLTASLTNCGTGLRLSVMVHLPGLALAGKLEEKLGAARTLGGAVRGLYGEASGAVGDVYQISNAVSIGLSERQISARLAAVTTFLSTDEQATRELLWRRERSIIEAKVADATANLKSAERLSAPEAMSLLSILRLGSLLEHPDRSHDPGVQRTARFHAYRGAVCFRRKSAVYVLRGNAPSGADPQQDTRTKTITILTD